MKNLKSEGQNAGALGVEGKETLQVSRKSHCPPGRGRKLEEKRGVSVGDKQSLWHLRPWV